LFATKAVSNSPIVSPQFSQVSILLSFESDIDYQPAGAMATKRLVLGFNELGMWITFNREVTATLDDLHR
jgi:hypothetical protein